MLQVFLGRVYVPVDERQVVAQLTSSSAEVSRRFALSLAASESRAAQNNYTFA